MAWVCILCRSLALHVNLTVVSFAPKKASRIVHRWTNEAKSQLVRYQYCCLRRFRALPGVEVRVLEEARSQKPEARSHGGIEAWSEQITESPILASGF